MQGKSARELQKRMFTTICKNDLMRLINVEGTPEKVKLIARGTQKKVGTLLLWESGGVRPAYTRDFASKVSSSVSDEIHRLKNELLYAVTQHAENMVKNSKLEICTENNIKVEIDSNIDWFNGLVGTEPITLTISVLEKKTWQYRHVTTTFVKLALPFTEFAIPNSTEIEMRCQGDTVSYVSMSMKITPAKLASILNDGDCLKLKREQHSEKAEQWVRKLSCAFKNAQDTISHTAHLLIDGESGFLMNADSKEVRMAHNDFEQKSITDWSTQRTGVAR